MTKTIVAVGAHAGDIEIFAGGTLLKYVERGYRVVYVIATNNMSGKRVRRLPGGVKADNPGSLEMIKLKKAEAVAAAHAVNAYPLFLEHPQHKCNSGGKIVELRYGCAIPEGVSEKVPSILTAHENVESRNILNDIIAGSDPEWIISHGVDNGNIEHIATAFLAAKCYRDVAGSGCKGGLLLWQEGCWDVGDTNKLWDASVDITGYMDKKEELINRCFSGREEYDFRQKNKEWGAKCGCGFAEIFITAGTGDAEPLT